MAKISKDLCLRIDEVEYNNFQSVLDLFEAQNRVIYDNSEVIPGVTSFSNASAKVKKPLCIGDGSFSIVPLHKDNVVNTTVYMRPKIGMNTDVIFPKGDIYTFENLNFRGETISRNKKEIVDKYMTLFIDFVQ